MKYMQLSLGNRHAIFVLIFSSSPLFILQVRVYLDQIGKVTEDGRQYALNLDSTKWKFVDVEKKSQSLKACLEAVQKESEQCKHIITDLQVELKNERWVKIIFSCLVHHCCHVLHGSTIQSIILHAPGLGKRELNRSLWTQNLHASVPLMTVK